MYQQILVKCPNIKFHANLFRDSVLVTRRQMDRHGNAYRCILLQLLTVNKPKSVY